jgi:hypothetical protein
LAKVKLSCPQRTRGRTDYLRSRCEVKHQHGARIWPDARAWNAIDGNSGVAMRLRQTSKATIALLTGGDPPKSGRGEAFAPHGYFGVETQVVDTIARFINANTAH